MKTILERLKALSFNQLQNVSELDDPCILYSEDVNKLINEIDAATYCGDISVDVIIELYPNF